MPKPPLNDRIKALEEANALLMGKIDRMKAQVRHNRQVIRKMQNRAENERRITQSKNDRAHHYECKSAAQRSQQAEEYRKAMEKRLYECRVMNGLIASD